MFMPLLSVILPVYNGEIFVSRAINSVLEQDFSDWELIIIDDGSSDHTSQICTDFCLKDKRIQYYYQKNRGLSAARNAGFRHASGKFIAYLDADDYVEFDYYRELISSAENSGADFVVAGFFRDFIYPNKQLKQVQVSLKEIFCTRDNLAIYNSNIDFYNLYIHVWNKLYRYDFLMSHQIFFNEKLQFGEDVPYNILNLQHAKTVQFLPIVGYHYICHPCERLTSKWDISLMKYNINIYEQIVNFEQRYLKSNNHEIASGMYLRGCFLSIEKALNAGITYRAICPVIKQILESDTTYCSIKNLKGNKREEFKIYKIILQAQCPFIFYMAVIARKYLKKLLRR